MDAARLAHEHLVVTAQQFTAGLKAGKEISRIAHTALKVAYAAAQQDQAVKIPTVLSCAIENILRLREEQQINDYANDAIKRDKEVPQWERDVRTGARDIPVGR